MYDVVTIGSGTLDIFLLSQEFSLVEHNGKMALCERFNEKVDVEQGSIASGGGATNTAVGFARLGFQTACIAELGKDFAGKVVERELSDEGVDTSFLVRETREDTALSALLIAPQGGRTALVYRGASRMLTIEDIPWERLQTRWIHLTTIGNAQVIERVLQFCKKKKIALSWNPGNWEIERILNGQLKPDWKSISALFVNREEMSRLSGVDLSLEENWKSSWCFAGPKISVVTDGKNGGRYCVDGTCFWYAAEEVRTIQETGAGDAFACGFVAGRLVGKTVEESIEFGKKQAAAVIQEIGAKKGLLYYQELLSPSR